MSDVPILLVTGASGFVGGHVQRAAEAGRFAGYTMVPFAPGLDLRDAAATRSFVESVRPDAVLHLAAQSFVPRSFEAPRETYEINVLGTLSLLEALDHARFKGRFLYVSSGDIYGRVPDSALPVDESRWPEPRSPYGASKVAAEALCLQWHRSSGLRVNIARPFNHIGPGQSPSFVVPGLARQVRAIAEGRQTPMIEAGDIDTTRDFTDVRDVVGAYAAIISRGAEGATYVVGSGREVRIREILGMLCALRGIDPEIRQDAAKIRPAEQRRMVCSAALLHADTGWAPQIALADTLNDILEDAGE